MGYGELIKVGLRENKVSIARAALWLNITRQGFHKKLNSGNFFIDEVNTLISMGALSKRRAYSLLSVNPIVSQNETFNVGSKVQCILKDAIWTNNAGKTINGPKHKEECTVSEIDENGDLLLEEYPIKEGFWAGAFKLKKNNTLIINK